MAVIGLIMAILASVAVLLFSLLAVRLSESAGNVWLSGFACAVIGLFVIWSIWAAWQ